MLLKNQKILIRCEPKAVQYWKYCKFYIVADRIHPPQSLDSNAFRNAIFFRDIHPVPPHPHCLISIYRLIPILFCHKILLRDFIFNFPPKIFGCLSESIQESGAKQYVNFFFSMEEPRPAWKSEIWNIPKKIFLSMTDFFIHSREIYLGQCLGIIRRYGLVFGRIGLPSKIKYIYIYIYINSISISLSMIWYMDESFCDMDMFCAQYDQMTPMPQNRLNRVS